MSVAKNTLENTNCSTITVTDIIIQSISTTGSETSLPRFNEGITGIGA